MILLQSKSIQLSHGQIKQQLQVQIIQAKYDSLSLVYLFIYLYFLFLYCLEHFHFFF